METNPLCHKGHRCQVNTRSFLASVTTFFWGRYNKVQIWQEAKKQKWFEGCKAVNRGGNCFCCLLKENEKNRAARSLKISTAGRPKTPNLFGPGANWAKLQIKTQTVQGGGGGGGTLQHCDASHICPSSPRLNSTQLGSNSGGWRRGVPFLVSPPPKKYSFSPTRADSSWRRPNPPPIATDRPRSSSPGSSRARLERRSVRELSQVVKGNRGDRRARLRGPCRPRPQTNQRNSILQATTQKEDEEEEEGGKKAGIDLPLGLGLCLWLCLRGERPRRHP